MKNVQLALVASVFAVTMVFVAIPHLTHTAPVAEACCGTDPVDPVDPVDPGNPGDSGTPSHPPVCNITASVTSVNAGGQYTISWNGTPSSASFQLNGTTVKDKDSLTVTFDGQYDYFRYVLYGINADGECSKEVVVYKNVVAPVCDVSLSVTEVAIGDTYTITWNGTPVAATFKMNGKSVADAGSKTFTFVGPNTETYTFTGANGSKTCSKTVTVSKKTTPAPSCVLTAAPATINAGGSSKLTWTAQNAVSGAIDQGIGSVNPNNTAGFRDVTPTGTKTYTMTVVNEAGATAHCTATVTVRTVTPAPTCDSFVATPATINKGQQSVLKWTTSNASVVGINNGVGSVVVDGTYTVTPRTTTTYTLTAVGTAGRTVSCPVTVTVRATVPAPTCTLSVDPSSIKKGETVQLTWTSRNAVSGAINQGIGAITLANTAGRSVSPTVNTTYVMTVVNSAGVTATCSDTVTVTHVPADTVPSCDSFTASRMTLPYGGGNTTLTWATTRAKTVAINQGIGSVVVDGSKPVSITATTVFLLTATDADGDTDTCSVKVLVEPKTHTPISCEDNVTFTASPSSIDEGDSSTLTWNTTGITSLSISGISATALDGSESVSPSSDTTYTMTAHKGSETIYCSVKVTVDESSNGGHHSSPSPRCDISISDKSIALGERVTLKWNTSNTYDLTITDDDNKVLVTTEDMSSRDKDDILDGEMTLRPEKDMTYTLRAERGSKHDECEVSVDVSGAVVAQIRDQQPLVSGIALTQVPYTGFEAGPIMTLFFYGLLMLWALYLAYVLVVRRNGGSPEVVAATAGQIVSDTNVPHALFTPTMVPTPVFHQSAPVAVAAPASAVVGFGSEVKDATIDAIENHAHAAQVLLSVDAIRAFTGVTSEANRMHTLDVVLATAKASYPAEDGWVIVGEERMRALTASITPAIVSPFTPDSVVATHN